MNNNPKVRWVTPSQEKQSKTYDSSGAFLDALRRDVLIEGFFLTETVFQELMGEICLSEQVRKEINDRGVLILLKADKGSEVDGLVAFAQGCVDGEKMAQHRNRV